MASSTGEPLLLLLLLYASALSRVHFDDGSLTPGLVRRTAGASLSAASSNVQKGLLEGALRGIASASGCILGEGEKSELTEAERDLEEWMVLVVVAAAPSLASLSSILRGSFTHAASRFCVAVLTAGWCCTGDGLRRRGNDSVAELCSVPLVSAALSASLCGQPMSVHALSSAAFIGRRVLAKPSSSNCGLLCRHEGDDEEVEDAEEAVEGARSVAGAVASTLPLFHCVTSRTISVKAALGMERRLTGGGGRRGDDNEGDTDHASTVAA